MSIRNTDYFSLNRGGTPTQANSGTYHVVTGTELKEFVQPKAVTAAPTAPPTANESGYAIDTSVEPHQMYKWDTATSTWKPIGGASKPPLRGRAGRGVDFTTLTTRYYSRVGASTGYGTFELDLPPNDMGPTNRRSWLGNLGEKVNFYGRSLIEGTVAAHVRRMRIDLLVIHDGYPYILSTEVEAGQSFELGELGSSRFGINVDGATAVEVSNLSSYEPPVYTYGAGHTGPSAGWLTGEDEHVGDTAFVTGERYYADSTVGSAPFPIDVSLSAGGSGRFAMTWRAVVLLDDEHTSASAISASPWVMKAYGTAQTMNLEVVGEELVAPVVWTMTGSPPAGASITGAGQTATLTATPPDQDHYPVLIRATGDDGKFVEYATNLRSLPAAVITYNNTNWDPYQFEQVRLYFSDQGSTANGIGRPFSTYATGVTLSGPDAAFFTYSSGRLRPAGPGPGASGRSQFYSPAADADGNNYYEVTVTATDSHTGDTLSRNIRVQLLTKPVTAISASGIFTTPSGTTAAGTVYPSSRAHDGTPLPLTAITLLPLKDGALFNYDSATGAVTFNSAPDVNNPQDYDKDNEYYYVLQAVSGTETVTKEVKVTVT